MYNRLLVATDTSSAAYAVVNCLHGLKAFGAKECLLLECLTLNEINPMMLDFAKSAAEMNLEKQKEILEKEGFKVETRCVEGVPGRMINQIADEGNYSLVITGAIRRSLINEAFLGGLAYEIIHSTHKPVFLVRLKEHPSQGIICSQPDDCVFNSHILFPTDFSANATLAFSHVKELVKAGAGKVTLMHVQDQFKMDPYLMDRLADFNQIDEERLMFMQEVLRNMGCPTVEIKLAFGSPAVEIIHTAKEEAASLIVMGSQGRGFMQELFLGSVSHNVARHAPAAVLLIPAAR